MNTIRYKLLNLRRAWPKMLDQRGTSWRDLLWDK